MPIKTNHITRFFLILCTLSPIVFIHGRAVAQDGAGAQAKQRLTPEERAAEKQRALELQKELALIRQQNFGVLPKGDDSEIGKKYQEAYDRFRAAAVDLNEVQMKFHLTTTLTQSFKDQVNRDWQAAMHAGHLAKENWLKAAAETFASDNEKYVVIGETLCAMMLTDVELDRMDGWLEAAKAVVNSKKFEKEDVLRAASLIGYASCDFDFTEDCLIRSEKFHTANETKPKFVGEIKTLREKWARELEFRRVEAEKNDNPRVEINTTKGRIVLELYEDSAPETVKSFIFLVERGFYTRKSFFRVEKHLCAQFGCEKGDGKGDAGYTISSEASLPNHRDHFRGTISMALGTDTNGKIMHDTGSSQVYFSFLPMAQMDGSYTVFGRIIEGQETMNTFRVMNLADPSQKKEGLQPDMILSAKVLRKRDAEYKPQILAGKLPK